MLRTHSDLGYKQEQRFHLELGLLKMVHAQRLLPLEQLLSGEALKLPAAPREARSVRKSMLRQPARRQRRRESVAVTGTAGFATAAASPFKGPSPFEADRSRKSDPKAEVAGVYGRFVRATQQIKGADLCLVSARPKS